MAEQAKTGPEAPSTTEAPTVNIYEEMAAKMHATPDAPTPVVAEAAVSPADRQQSAKERIDKLMVTSKEKAVIDGLVDGIQMFATKDEKAALEAKRKEATKDVNPRTKSGREVVKTARETFEAEKQALVDGKKADAALPGIEQFLAASRKIGEKNFVTDAEQAHAEAMAAKTSIDAESDMRFETTVDEADPDKKITLTEKTLNADEAFRANELRKSSIETGVKAGEKHIEATRKRSETFVKSMGEITNLVAKSEGVLPVVRGETPEDTTMISADLQRALKVDLTDAPLKAEAHGNALRKNRTVDIYRESTDPANKGMVFVEQVDSTTGETIRLDVIKGEKPDQPKNASGELKDTLRYRNEMRKWESKIEDQLKAAREGSTFTAGKSSLYKAENSNGHVSDILKKRGVAGVHFGGESGKQKVKTKSKPWWQGLFSGSGN